MFKFSRSSDLPSLEDYQALHAKLLRAVELAEHYVGAHHRFSKLILTAKKEFSVLAGDIIDSEDYYLPRIKSYLYWFLFDWKIPPHKQEVPIKHYIATINDADERSFVNALTNNYHSLYELSKRTKKATRLFDLFAKNYIYLADIDAFYGLEEGDFFETRLFKVNDCYLPADYYISHPPQIYKRVKKKIRLIQDNGIESKNLILQLQRSFTRWKTYKMMDVESIYNIN